jgi:hypothetical protein
MIGFCPDGYVSSQEAVLRAAQFWFPEKVASLDTVVLENVNKESVSSLSYPQLPEELRKLFEGITGQTVPRLRNFLHQGKLKAYYFENDGCRTVSRKFWATAQADGVIESGTYWPFGKPTRWYDKQPNYSLFMKQSELDALQVVEPAENRRFPMDKKKDLAAAYRSPEIATLASRKSQREAIRKLEQFKSYRITDSLFREAENASGKREPGVKRRQDD